MRLYLLGLRTSVRNNASAYGYSVTITATLAAAQAQSTLTTIRLFAFVVAAAMAFIVVEAAASNLFRNRERTDPADVVVLGSAFSLFSVTAGFSAALPATWWLDGWVVWPVASASATAAYLLAVGVEMALARRAEGDEGE